MDPPAGPREGSADIHGGAVAGQETREDERRRPVLRAARAHGAEACKEAREVPSDFTHSLPTRTEQGRPGEPCRQSRQPRFAPTSRDEEVYLLRYRNNKPLESAVLSGIVDFTHHVPRRPCRHSERHWVQSSSTSSSRSSSSPRAARGAIRPSRRDHSARCGTGGFSVILGIGGSSTLCPAIHS